MAPARPPARCDGVEVMIGNERRCLRPKDNFKDCDTCPEMVVIPSGEFTMGSPKSQEGRSDSEEPQHKVIIDKPLAAGRYAVTRGEFTAFVSETKHTTGDKCWTYDNAKWAERTGRSFHNSGFAQDDRHPVVCANWGDAKAFVAWLSKKTSQPYRLLTEAEREYATRAGTSTPFWWGASISTAQANYDGNQTYGGGSEGEWRMKTVAVDSFRPNPWGLYNVHGNVWEWVEDCWHENYEGAPANGSAWTSGGCAYRILRGGSWCYVPRVLRSAARDRLAPDSRYSNLGFRVARTLSH
jgi:formylglycine-generating enzyme required for sulfatase activity